MDDTLAELVRALSPVMNAVQAEGFLHVAAFTRRKSPEGLDIGDWPALERCIREMLQGTSSEEMADRICESLRQILLARAGGSSC